MENLTNRQRSILMNLFGESVKTEPLADLTRILKYYNDNLKDEDDQLIISQFKRLVENKLYFILSSNFKFHQLDYYVEKYEEQLQDYIEDVPDSLESDFIERCIAEQYSILDSSVKFYVELDFFIRIDVMEFVSEEFLDEYKNSSKRKIEFLQEKQNRIQLAQTSNNIIIENFEPQLENIIIYPENLDPQIESSDSHYEYINPHPDYFMLFGYELFIKFLEVDIKEKSKCLAKASFLVNKLRKEGLMNNSVSLAYIFKFSIEEFDLNFGKAYKFKSDYSVNKYIEAYNHLKNNFKNDN
jgi:hypothetical protein